MPRKINVDIKKTIITDNTEEITLPDKIYLITLMIKSKKGDDSIRRFVTHDARGYFHKRFFRDEQGQLPKKIEVIQCDEYDFKESIEFHEDKKEGRINGFFIPDKTRGSEKKAK